MSRSAFRTRIEVLGVPVDFEANTPLLLQAISSCLPSGTAHDSQPGRVPQVRLQLVTEDSATPQNIGFRTPAPHLLEIEGPGFRGRADAIRLEADCVLTSAVLESHVRLEETILYTLTLFLVTRLDRQPLHAAAISRLGHGLLIAGRSGSGKSTLAYTALCQGWTVLSDDAVYLQSQPAVRIWARSTRLYVPADAARWFPELALRAPVLRDNGKIRIPVELPTEETPQPLERAGLWLLEPGRGNPPIRRLDVDQALGSLLSGLDPGFDVFGATIEPVLRTLLQDGGAWAVQTGGDPRELLGPPWNS